MSFAPRTSIDSNMTKPAAAKVPAFLKAIKEKSGAAKEQIQGSMKDLKKAIAPRPQPKFLSENQAQGSTWTLLPSLGLRAAGNKATDVNDGRFMTHRKTSVVDNGSNSPGRPYSRSSSAKRRKSSLNPLALKNGRKSSVVSNSATLMPASGSESTHAAERRFWDAMDTHHVLPVFAAGKAYVPASFESLLVQSFYSVLTPVICDKLVCGQNHQTVMHCEVPENILGHRFMDVYRIMMQHHVSLK